MTHLPNRPVTRSGPAAGPADGGVPLHPERVAPTAFEPSAPPASAMAWSDLDALANAPSFGPTAVGPVPTGSAGPSAAESGDGRSQVRLRLGILAAAGPTLRDELAHIAPGTCWQELAQWPPDAFAATSTILADCGAYRGVVHPPDGMSWPPREGPFATESWSSVVRSVGADWAVRVAAVGRSSVAEDGVPEAVALATSLIDAAADMPLQRLTELAGWPVTSAILTLHAMADEACAGVGIEARTAFQRLAAAHLSETGSLSRLSSDRLRVIPKLRPPESGITLRSLSHHLALDRSEVRPRWLVAPRSLHWSEASSTRFTLLLVPYPRAIRASDFRPVEGPLLNMEQGFGFYEYAPSEPFAPTSVVALVEAAREAVGSVDAVVLPEAAIDEDAVATLQIELTEAGVPFLIAGVRGPGGDGIPFGRNYAYIGSGEWCATPQHKHHRWCLDQGQVLQYQLGGTLDPQRRWWEAIGVRERTLTFVTVPDSGRMTICPLVCEDLARPDPVSDLLRAVAPTLVVGLLLDGPQLASRWAARYATALADDPGCSVLTLTALGMALRSQPAGVTPSRAIALWKDPSRGLHQISIAEGAHAVALTAHRRDVAPTSADGRRSARPASQLVLSGVEQIF